MTDEERKWIAEKQAELDAMLENDPGHYVATRRRFQQEYEKRFSSEQEQPSLSALRAILHLMIDTVPDSKLVEFSRRIHVTTADMEG